ncbi:Variant surface glycoprotein [Trypanosoma congolense IL3000]|uniref:Variant surface glycoprotein n=1 Tax=Trypanosoma congolense (strain IL3000) TaxID=1068625 RepID=F9WAW8_TRYCI|nr:Variant surface glycoprotein [Trypanosoma congolense IL3000]
MWRYFLLLILAVGYISIEARTSSEAIYRQLCNITNDAVAILRLNGKRSALREAIYGRYGRALFNDNGIVTIPARCGDAPSGRGVLCNYFKGGRQGDGCLAESLLGTLMCVCAPGARDDKKLCGTEPWEFDGAWWGGFGSNKERDSLFKDVWKKVISKCLVGNKHHSSTLEKLKSLEQTLKAIRGTLRSRAWGGTNYFYLGQSAVTSCGGGIHDGEGICVAYRGGSGETKDSVNIPWITEIEKATNELIEIVPKQPIESQAEADSPSAEKEADLPIPAEGNEQLNENESLKRGNPTEKFVTQTVSAEYEPQFNKSKRIPKLAKPEEKGNPHKYNIIDIPHLATNPDEDGSILICKKWLLLSILFN